MSKRAVILVLDGVGVGELPDAAEYGDQGSNTLRNVAKVVGGLPLPHLEQLGLGNIIEICGVKTVTAPRAFFGKMQEVSAGKDTTTGHWEIAGVPVFKPFPTYPEGFPEEVVDRFVKAIGIGILGNYPASGTKIIEDLGSEHVRTGKPIIYTSADSVFQIAAHEEVIPPERLYELCEVARGILVGEHGVARVIARPFIGDETTGYTRTPRRRDFSLPPPAPTLLDILSEAGYPVCGVGKIPDIFAQRGITEKLPGKDNREIILQTAAWLQDADQGLIWANCVDFDTLYGHRNDPEGFAKALAEVDSLLPKLLGVLRDEDLCIITADHGCDPTTTSTDHSREYVPLLAFTPKRGLGKNLGVRQTFSDVAATISEFFGLIPRFNAQSFLRDILGGGASARS
ncbi:MAG TPA: phosphopentomutase [Firmicutes bacterium]|nr:phosphopentomutase [Bacillota bacterium]